MATAAKLLDEITPGATAVTYDVTDLKDVEYNGKYFTFMLKVTDTNSVQFGRGSISAVAKAFTSADGIIIFTCLTDQLTAKGANSSSKFTIMG